MLTRTFIKHAGITLAAIGLLVVVPVFSHFPLTFGKTQVDANSSASIELPDTPSGQYYILVKESFVQDDSPEDWEAFLSADEEDVLPVLFDDVHCMVAEGDVYGAQLAERYQAILSPDQMTITSEEPTLFISKAEAGYIEMAIISADMADSLGFSTDEQAEQVTLLTVSGD